MVAIAVGRRGGGRLRLGAARRCQRGVSRDPGIAALNHENADFITLSCASPGNCSVGGFFVDRHLAGQAFVANQVHGTWGKAIEVPGTAALNAGGEAGMESLSCASPGRCSAGGFYGDSHGKLQGFVVSET